ncbi:hypothetical protein Zmor_013963 [Zophobas morio]|uniref:Uncharacterized protein n=1 Tax=Zophobas morio TaxID=2755281 RepID=A0AA38MFQ7_9CUCU|nr:hypothetical protein Zmor_013963 [Zophobas morio]
MQVASSNITVTQYWCNVHTSRRPIIELASKGFCVPPELTDESEEGVSKPSDSLGLGEGQGERDVSDRIESEDQLDDAQSAGQEKEKTEDEDCKEEDKGIEMSEDFDTKLQNVEPKEGEDDEESQSESDADEQMGDTEKDANKQNKESFGSDNEEGNDNSEEKEERGEGGEKDGEQELGAKDDDNSKGDDNKPDKDSTEEKEENKKEINEMEEQEYDDEQTDPYHENQPELPEPEAMDLPDDLQLDEGQKQDEENQEEDPFDIDTIKEDNPFETKDKEDELKENEEEDKPEDNYSSDEENIIKTQNDEPDQEEKEEDSETKQPDELPEKAQEEENNDDKGEHENESGVDQTETNEDNVEAMEVDNAEATDKTIPNQSQNQKTNQPNEELCQEDKPDKEGKVKTVDAKDDGNEHEEGEELDLDKNEEAELYKHIKEAKESSTYRYIHLKNKIKSVQEQAKTQKYEVPNPEDEETGENPTESSANLPAEEEEMVDSADRYRNNHILYDEPRNMSALRLTQEEINSLRSSVEKQLSSWTEVPSGIEADQAWQKISSLMSSLAQDPCEQLRLVLELTQSSGLKGDY